jgi:hypothetical protein
MYLLKNKNKKLTRGRLTPLALFTVSRFYCGVENSHLLKMGLCTQHNIFDSKKKYRTKSVTLTLSTTCLKEFSSTDSFFHYFFHTVLQQIAIMIDILYYNKIDDAPREYYLLRDRE